LQKTANDLQAAQSRLINLYSQHLNKTEDELKDLMLQDKFINANEALELGLINEIREDSIEQLEGETAKAMFYNLKRKKVNNLTKEELNTELGKFEEGILDKIKNFFKKPDIKALVLKDTAGVELDFSVDTEEEIAVGVTATANGEAANGEYVMPDGSVYVFEAGTLSEIKEPEAEGDDMEALKQENEDLKAKVSELETAQNSHEETIQNLKTDYESKLNDIQEGFTAFKNKFSNKVVDNNTPEVEKEKSNKAFKNKQTIKI
jgi:enoyl-CoA hydratase/carnithine racemase